LAVAAHALAGGALPSGGVAALLIVVSLATGLAAMTERASHGAVLLAVLAAGQFAAHVSMAAVGHSHGDSVALSWPFMLLTHGLAVAAGARLMSLSEWLFGSLCRVVRRCVAVLQMPARLAAAPGIRPEYQPLQHVSLLAFSISHRGPPARARS